jgi:hypothetical protein
MAANTQVKFASMLTLTYGKEMPTNGAQVKGHWNRFITSWRHHISLSYIWVMEFTGKGVPHLHVLTTVDVSEYDKSDRLDVAHRWTRSVLGKRGAEYCDLSVYTERSLYAEMVSVHSHPDALKPLWSDDGAMKYIVSYAAKLEQKEVPVTFRDIGRMWGASRDVSASVRPLYQIPIASDDQLQKLLIEMGRDDLIDWDIIPSMVLTL